MAAGGFAASVYLALLNSPIVSPDLQPPVPILRSAWLVLHVAFAFVGLALFTVGCVAAIIGFTQADPTSADRARDRSIAIGFAFYAVGGLVFGAVWAEAAWGRFWGWDPKETWALITTLLYAGYLHLRHLGEVRPAVSPSWRGSSPVHLLRRELPAPRPALLP
jgi:ABC-type transport system involved in cytochrome c biogenesis permease subunit